MPPPEAGTCLQKYTLRYTQACTHAHMARVQLHCISILDKDMESNPYPPTAPLHVL